MPALSTFDTGYPASPWSGISTNQREVYDPNLEDIYYSGALYSRFVTIQHDLKGDANTTTMHITSLIPPHPNFDPIALRTLWLTSSRIDSREREVTVSKYGGKLSLTKDDENITYWRQNGQVGLIPIINKYIGYDMVEQMEMLARNSFLSGAFQMIGDGTADFSNIDTTQTMKTAIIDKIRLMMEYRKAPFTTNSFTGGNLICVTTPGVVYDLMHEASSTGNPNTWKEAALYAGATRLLDGEVGMYHGVRFVKSDKAMLWNCGPITVQTTLSAAVAAGSGAPNPATTKVDGVFKTGQASGVTYYVQVADVTSFAVGDWVTVHTDRTSANGVTNGVDYTDGTAQVREIHSIDTGNNRLTFTEPIMFPFATDLGGGVYGYVTKARHVHTALFLGGTNGVVMGVIQPPRVAVREPIDDFGMMYRVSWDGHFGYNVYEPQAYNLWFGAGSFGYRDSVSVV